MLRQTQSDVKSTKLL